MTQELTPSSAPRAQRTLREIVEQLNDVIELNEGEITDDVELLELALTEKVESYRFVMRELEAESHMLEELSKDYYTRAVARRVKVESLKKRLQTALEASGKDKVKTPSCTAYLQSSKYVAIEDVNAFVQSAEDRFVAMTVTPHKAEIKKALEAGETVEGASIKTRRSLGFR